jgi:hypothetical protein
MTEDAQRFEEIVERIELRNSERDDQSVGKITYFATLADAAELIAMVERRDKRIEQLEGAIERYAKKGPECFCSTDIDRDFCPRHILLATLDNTESETCGTCKGEGRIQDPM